MKQQLYATIVGLTLVLTSSLAQAEIIARRHLCSLKNVQVALGIGDPTAVRVELVQTYDQLVKKEATLAVREGAKQIVVMTLKHLQSFSTLGDVKDIPSIDGDVYKNIPQETSLEMTLVRSSEGLPVAQVGSIALITRNQSNGSFKELIESGLVCD